MLRSLQKLERFGLRLEVEETFPDCLRFRSLLQSKPHLFAAATNVRNGNRSHLSSNMASTVFDVLWDVPRQACSWQPRFLFLFLFGPARFHSLCTLTNVLELLVDLRVDSSGANSHTGKQSFDA